MLSLLVTSSQAATIFTTGAPVGGESGNETTQWVQAGQFSIAGGGSVASAGVYIGSTVGPLLTVWDGNLDYFIFADSGGAPGALQASGAGQNVQTTDTSTAWCCGGNGFLFEFDLVNPFAAAAATNYWFGIHLSSNFDRDELYWMSHAGGGGGASESNGGTFDNWSPNSDTRVFFLADTPVGTQVPEPGTLSLFGLGALGLVWVRRRRR